MTWPLALHLASETAQVESYDPLYLTWQVAWIGHALLHAPLHLLQSNLYWPLAHNLTFTDVVFGYAPAGLLAAHGPHAALIVHNLLFIFTYAFAFLGAYLLAGELGAGEWGGVVAGAAFAYAPWKLEQNGHLHVLSSGVIPLCAVSAVARLSARQPRLHRRRLAPCSSRLFPPGRSSPCGFTAFSVPLQKGNITVRDALGKRRHARARRPTWCGPSRVWRGPRVPGGACALDFACCLTSSSPRSKPSAAFRRRGVGLARIRSRCLRFLELLVL
jgi:hypothetical protein